MKEFLARYVDAEAFDKLLSGYLRGVDIPDALKLPSDNSLLSVGKRLRPALCYLGSDLAGGDRRDADPFAAAIECIHCYSLVHDDLECMDNDAYRHGKDTQYARAVSARKRQREKTAALKRRDHEIDLRSDGTSRVAGSF